MAASKTGGGVGTNQYAIKGSSIVDQVAAANRAAALTDDLDGDSLDPCQVLNERIAAGDMIRLDRGDGRFAAIDTTPVEDADVFGDIELDEVFSFRACRDLGDGTWESVTVTYGNVENPLSGDDYMQHAIAEHTAAGILDMWNGSWYPVKDGHRQGFGWSDPADALTRAAPGWDAVKRCGRPALSRQVHTVFCTDPTQPADTELRVDVEYSDQPGYTAGMALLEARTEIAVIVENPADPDSDIFG